MQIRKAGIQDWLLWLIGINKIRKIAGDSMLPLLHQSEKIFCRKVYTGARVKIGDIVIAKHPYKKIEIVKQINAIKKNNTYNLVGTNKSSSTDSRTYGNLDSSKIISKIISKI